MAWACDACTFLNPSHRPSCEICGTARPSDPGPAVDQYNEAALQAAMARSQIATNPSSRINTPPLSSAPFGQASSAPFGQTSSAPFGQIAPAAPLPPSEASGPAAVVEETEPDLTGLVGLSEQEQLAQVLSFSREADRREWEYRTRGIKVVSEPSEGEAGCLNIYLVVGNQQLSRRFWSDTVSYTHLRAHETPEHLVCRLLLEKKKKK
eukprot:TRINITY_DN2616_c0_g1_i3.p1 TRINITY_DN2616_c0_g1~~TRINITY_DN2616_c0_g1_i3.p1  ORF type:complete len:208 (-),score=44.34 TRINITY_DN2616_c0_g1_i3:100-723(-)